MLVIVATCASCSFYLDAHLSYSHVLSMYVLVRDRIVQAY